MAEHIHTVQMETDTTTEEREAILQAAIGARTVEQARKVRDQIVEHMEMYEGDEGLAPLREQLTRLDQMLGEGTPDSIGYMVSEEGGAA
jgi:hypothetical protein